MSEAEDLMQSHDAQPQTPCAWTLARARALGLDDAEICRYMGDFDAGQKGAKPV